MRRNVDEQNANARPKIVVELPRLDGYDPTPWSRPIPRRAGEDVAGAGRAVDAWLRSTGLAP